MNQVRPRGGNADIYRPPQQVNSKELLKKPLLSQALCRSHHDRRSAVH